MRLSADGGRAIINATLITSVCTVPQYTTPLDTQPLDDEEDNAKTVTWGSQVAERLGNGASNLKVAGSIPRA